MLAGANLENDDVVPILSRTGLFDSATVEALDRWVRRTWWPFTRKRFVSVAWSGDLHHVRITCHKDDIGESEISFRGPDAVVALIRDAIRAHMAEQGR